mmetsp:Transcript_56036/g.132150  ORF Transcript_56036/g.132150 Transcript_56036/m.132150 type:complete len:222 (-) Transcript_56036:18-683(-)
MAAWEFGPAGSPGSPGFDFVVRTERQDVRSRKMVLAGTGLLLVAAVLGVVSAVTPGSLTVQSLAAAPAAAPTTTTAAPAAAPVTAAAPAAAPSLGPQTGWKLNPNTNPQDFDINKVSAEVSKIPAYGGGGAKMTTNGVVLDSDLIKHLKEAQVAADEFPNVNPHTKPAPSQTWSGFGVNPTSKAQVKMQIKKLLSQYSNVVRPSRQWSGFGNNPNPKPAFK